MQRTSRDFRLLHSRNPNSHEFGYNRAVRRPLSGVLENEVPSLPRIGVVVSGPGNSR